MQKDAKARSIRFSHSSGWFHFPRSDLIVAMSKKSASEIAGSSPEPKRHDPGDDLKEEEPGLLSQRILDEPLFSQGVANPAAPIPLVWPRPSASGPGSSLSIDVDKKLNTLTDSVQALIQLQTQQMQAMTAQAAQSEQLMQMHLKSIDEFRKSMPTTTSTTTAEAPKPPGGDADMSTGEFGADVLEAISLAGKHQDIASQKVPASVVAKIKKEGAIMKRRILSLNRTQEHILKLEGQVDSLTTGVVPSNMKRFSLPWTTEHFQHKLGDEFANETKDRFDYIMDPEKSFEEMKKVYYIKFLVVDTLMNLQVEKIRCKELQRESSLEAFLAMCDAGADGDREFVDKILQGVRTPPGLFVPWKKEATILAVRHYDLIVQQCAKYRKEVERKVVKQRVDRQELLDEAARLSGPEVLGRVVQSFIKKGGKVTKGDIDYLSMLRVEVDPPKVIDKTLLPNERTGNLPKNGKSPDGGRGHNTMKAQRPQTMKGSSKGAPKGASKGKSKGRGKGGVATKGTHPPKNIGFGKAKGKGKHKTMLTTGKGAGSKGKGRGSKSGGKPWA